MGKGSLVGVDGRIQTRNFDNQEGQRVFVTEVVADSIQFLESKGGSGGGQPNQGSQGYNQNQNQNQPSQANQNQYNQNNNNNNNQNQNNQNNQGNNGGDSPFQDSGEPIDISDDDLPF
ncbi:single-stranded DNA-binding protein [Gracilibacillus boraciitolerans JCM 21714]|uniref:Single-stranded DNA-binding protein n=1 Tax=Gracilibacillus boraciitolerans JCM 21714 TaxID=1298598 RepID=W4VL16_9BACI|nr:single-stranded DNA-binding protein [Gracilibacillus boraciitolerans JCM 21714]